MLNFSAYIPETHRDISSGFVETLFQARREELFTGVMRLSYSTGENWMFMFVQGVRQKLYRCLEHSIDVVTPQSWFDGQDHGVLSAGFMNLPVEAMRFIQVGCEARVVRVETSTFTPEALIDAARQWSAGQEPGLIHMQSDVLNKYCLIAGHSIPIVEELFFGAGGARFSLSDASFSQTLPKVEYQVTRYIGSSADKVWLEYELRLTFSQLFRMLLNRFGELAGRALMGRLCERLAIWAAEGGWDVAITGNGIVNRHYFETLESALGFYVGILRQFQVEATPALGGRMLDGISRDVLIKLDPYRRELLTRHIYNQSGAGGVMSVV
jgi:hypothetical protein